MYSWLLLSWLLSKEEVFVVVKEKRKVFRSCFQIDFVSEASFIILFRWEKGEALFVLCTTFYY